MSFEAKRDFGKVIINPDGGLSFKHLDDPTRTALEQYVHDRLEVAQNNHRKLPFGHPVRRLQRKLERSKVK